MPPSLIAEFAMHVPREHNKEADALANKCLDDGHDVITFSCEQLQRRWPMMIMACDGASRGNPGLASMGIVLKGSSSEGEGWETFFEVGMQLGKTNSMQAEMAAMAHAIVWAVKLAKGTLSAEDMKVMDMLCPW